jgi:hypothetical protein
LKFVEANPRLPPSLSSKPALHTHSIHLTSTVQSIVVKRTPSYLFTSAELLRLFNHLQISPYRKTGYKICIVSISLFAEQCMQNTQVSEEVSEDSFLTCSAVNMHQFAISFLAAASACLAAPIFNISRQLEVHSQTFTAACINTPTITIHNCINCKIVHVG